VFVLIVRPASRFDKADEAAAGPTEIDLLREIRDELRARPLGTDLDRA
jgi:hypothetical protein